jgi:hypothetical protein
MNFMICEKEVLPLFVFVFFSKTPFSGRWATFDVEKNHHLFVFFLVQNNFVFLVRQKQNQ